MPARAWIENNDATLHCGVFIIARMATIDGVWFDRFHSGNKPLRQYDVLCYRPESKQVSLFVNRNIFFTLKIESKGIL